MSIAPTALEALGIARPEHMRWPSLLHAEAAFQASASHP